MTYGVICVIQGGGYTARLDLNGDEYFGGVAAGKRFDSKDDATKWLEKLAKKLEIEKYEILVQSLSGDGTETLDDMTKRLIEENKGG